jgi:uncharacterized protein (DUF1501 family)
MPSSRANRIGCPEFRESLALSRRGFLRAGMLGCGGLTLASLLRLEAAARAAGQSISRQKSVIILWMRGGPSQHETWDPKPDAPQEYRGAFGAMRTKVPGIQICDLLPLSAGIMDQWSIVRSLYHTDAGHSRGDQICFTGYPPGPIDDQNVFPSCGSIVAKQLQEQNPKLPAYVVIPKNVPGTGAAYLGAKYAAFETGADPAQTGPFSVPNFALSQGLSLDRLDSRKGLLTALDRLRRDADASGQIETMDQFQQQAWDMVTNDQARTAFDLDAEPAKVRERYGFMPEYKAPTPDRCGVPAWSQRILLARRLVEAGVRLVTVDCRWWDTHVKGYETMRDGFLPRWDRAYTALIQDLRERGLLESTLVLAWGEFGRTPKVNSTGGRDHWPGVFSAAVAGGGVQGGRVVGASDAKGGEPADNAKTPQDMLATIYRHLGIDVAVNYSDHNGRPHPVLTSGKPIDELFA